MEAEIIKKLNLRNIKADLQQVQLTEEEEFQFAQRAYKVVKEFSAFSSKQNQKVGLTEFFVKNADRLFKQTKSSSLEAEVSRFVSVLSLHKNSTEVSLYRDLFLNNVGVKPAKLFVKFFLEMNQINLSLYENRTKLLKHLRIDIKKALNLSAIVLKDDVAISNFSQAISNYLENTKGNSHTITAEQFGKHLMGSYLLSRNIVEKNKDEGGEIWLNWNSVDPQAFEITVPLAPAPDTNTSNTIQPDHTVNENNTFLLERINADFRKEVKKQKTVTAENNKTASPISKPYVPPTSKTNGGAHPEGGNSNLFKICHKYVFADQPTYSTKLKTKNESPVDLSSDVDIDKQLIFLRTKLEKQKLELEMQKNIWKLILNNSKQAIRNYKELKGEISSTEALTNAFLNVIDKNTDEWRRLYIIKSNDVEDLYRYKFLIAAVLESCSQDLSRDLKDFRFAHGEDERQMDALLGQNKGFDLNEYLNAVYKSNKIKFDAALAAEELEKEHQNLDDDVDDEEDVGPENRQARLNDYNFNRNDDDQIKKLSEPLSSSRPFGNPSDPRIVSHTVGDYMEGYGGGDNDSAYQNETDEERAERLRNMRANLGRMKHDLTYGKKDTKSKSPSAAKNGTSC